MIFTEKLPIFPLNVVVLPGNELRLHIFEDRYKQMINECLEEDKEFGIIFTKGTQMQKIGCTVRITEVLRTYDDGCMDIKTVGMRRFHLNEIDKERIYLQSSVSFFDDETEKETGEMTQLANQGIRLLRKFERLSNHSHDRSHFDRLNFKIISFMLAGSGSLTADEKQKLLEMTSTHERLREAVSLLKESLQRAALINHIKKAEKEGVVKYGFSKN